MGWLDSEKETTTASSLIPSWVKDYVEIPPSALEQIDEATHFSSNQCIVLGAVCVTSLAVGFRAGRVRPMFRRITNVTDIPSSDLGSASPWLKGRVITVSDGDTLRFLHVPSIFHSSQLDPDVKLSEQTLAIRICTIDTPETAKFGKPGQPFGEDAKAYLSDLVLEKKCRVQLLTKDQYGRAVGQVQKPGWFGFKYADEYMLKAGLAEVYLGSGAVYGHRGKDAYLALKEKAKESKKGMWSQKNRESASEFKARTK
jgi:micrococcal nuclease